MTKKLVVACDFETTAELFSFLDETRDLSFIVKIALSSIPQLGDQDWSRLKNTQKELFVDAKLHDIPSQVSRAVRQWSKKGIDYLTLHLAASAEAIKGALSERESLTIFGVSYLTSLSEDDFKKLSLRAASPLELLLKRIELGVEAGMGSFVSSAVEAEAIKEKFPKLKLLCPGIFIHTQNSDQKRALSLDEAIEKPIDYFVLGRSIIHSENPRSEVEKVLEKINK